MTSPQDLRAKLKRLRREPGRPKSEPLEAPPKARGSLTIGPLENLTPVANEHGEYAERVARFPHDYRHGQFALAEVDHALHEAIALVARDVALAGIDLRRAVYLDIETTGLSGGTGTTAFLVALGVFEADGFHLWQGFLPGPEGERALLHDVARRIGARDAMVSFFGKSFDRHRLEDKMRVHGVEPPFAGRPHLDLYHPLSRLYREALPDGRLGTMERDLCGVARVNDLSGRYAPEAWFDFLAGRAHSLEDVFRHNADDVLSLVVLAAHLGRTLEERRGDGAPLPGPEHARAAALAQLHAERKERAEALCWVDRALARDPSRQLRFLKADLLAREGECSQALEEYAHVTHAQADELAVRAWVAVAKLAEHKLKDCAHALDAVDHAHRILDTGTLTPKGRKFRDELEHRETRLKRKTGAG